MRIAVLLLSILMVSCIAQARENNIFEFDHWVHRSTPDLNIDIVYYAKNPAKSMIFVVDPKIGCDARLVYSNQELEDLNLSPGEKFSWSLSGVLYEGDQSSHLNTNGYTRFELISFYKHHFEELEELLSHQGVIEFSMEDPGGRFETQRVQHQAKGLSQALSHALDRCQGWT